jgi:Holliday junction resolvasome RuvABC endonuclease subunit
MIKLSIKDIEKKLNKTIRQYSISIGFDVAEIFTGICILKSDKQYIEIDHLETITSDPKEDHFHRADHYEDALNKFKQLLEKYKVHKIMIIERPFFGRNVEILVHLAHFGILTYIILKRNFDSCYYFGATTARSMIGFNQKRQEENGTLKADVYSRDTKNRKGKLLHKKGEKKKIDCKSLVHNYLKTDFNIEIKDKDQADGFVLALAGLLK